MTYITKLYKSEQLIDVQNILKDIVTVWLNSDKTKPLEDWIILALQKQDYRIIKCGKLMEKNK